MVEVTGLVLRGEKGSNLNATEFDNNLIILKEAIESIPEVDAAAEITAITIESGNLVVYVDGEPFNAGPVPRLPITWRGNFAEEEYNPGDLINAPGGVYLVNAGHTGELPFNSELTIGVVKLYTLLVPTVFAIGLHWPTAPGFGLEDDDMMLGYLAETAFFLPAGLGGSRGRIRVNPAATITCDILKNATVIGSLSVSTGGVVSFSFAADVNFAIGDALYIAPPSAVDVEGRGLLITFKAFAGAT